LVHLEKWFCLKSEYAIKSNRSSTRSRGHPVATASGSDLTEYPGKQDFLQFADIRLSFWCLQETGHSDYNLPVTFRRARDGLSCLQGGEDLGALRPDDS
jgi:hypothetical protein